MVKKALKTARAERKAARELGKAPALTSVHQETDGHRPGPLSRATASSASLQRHGKSHARDNDYDERDEGSDDEADDEYDHDGDDDQEYRPRVRSENVKPRKHRSRDEGNTVEYERRPKQDRVEACRQDELSEEDDRDNASVDEDYDTASHVRGLDIMGPDILETCVYLFLLKSIEQGRTLTSPGDTSNT